LLRVIGPQARSGVVPSADERSVQGNLSTARRFRRLRFVV